jgi:hypothetical protein
MNVMKTTRCNLKEVCVQFAFTEIVLQFPTVQWRVALFEYCVGSTQERLLNSDVDRKRFCAHTGGATMGSAIKFVLSLFVTLSWILFSFYSGSYDSHVDYMSTHVASAAKIAFIPPVLVFTALASYWLLKHLWLHKHLMADRRGAPKP